MAYIYQITNDVNGKIYIGKTYRSVEERFAEHCREAFSDRGADRPLYKAMRKYGVDHFHISEIEETDTPEEREIFWIAEKDSFHYGYNATRGGDGKPWIDRKEVITLYQQKQNQAEVARILGISPYSVHNILVENGITIVKPLREDAIQISMYDLSDTLLKSFNSMGEAANFISENKYSTGTKNNIRNHISEVCSGKRKTAFGFHWKYN